MNKILRLMACPLLAIILCSAESVRATCAPINSKLLLWLPGEDSSSVVLNGVSIVQAPAGKVNNAFFIQSQGGFISVPRGSAWLPGTKDFTIEFWVNFESLSFIRDSTTPQPYFIGQDEGATSNEKWIFAMRQTAVDGITRIAFHVNNDCEFQGVWLVDAPFSPEIYTWYHLALVRAGNTFLIYINGQIAGAQASDIAVPNPKTSLTIGWAPGETGTGTQGRFDEVTIHARALCTSEIQAIYNAGSDGKCPISSPLVAPSNLVGWWAESDARDIVYGQTGLGYGEVGGWCDGKVGRSFVFDGSTAYIEVPHNSHLNIVGPFSIEVWIKYFEVEGANMCIVAKGIDAESPVDWALTVNEGKLRPHVKVNGEWKVFDCDTTITPEVWTHVAMVYDGTKIEGFVNGVSDGYISASGTVGSSRYPLRIGAYAPVNGTGSKCFFTGLIDELSLYDRALKAGEIAAIYNAGTVGKSLDSVIAWWPAECSAITQTAQDAYFLDIAGGRQGQTSGTVLKNKSGRVGSAFDFAGSSSFVSSAHDPSLTPVDAITVECWVNRRSVGGGSTDPIVVKAGSTAGYKLEFVNNNSRIRFSIYNGTWKTVEYDGDVQLGLWYHVAGVYDGTSLHCYVNGVSESTPTSASGQISPSNNNLAIGGFDGRVDELKIHVGGLSESKIKSIFEAATYGQPQP